MLLMMLAPSTGIGVLPAAYSPSSVKQTDTDGSGDISPLNTSAQAIADQPTDCGVKLIDIENRHVAN